MPWFRKTSKPQTRVGFVIGSDQLSLAHVEDRQGVPHLLNCRSASLSSEKSAPRVLSRLLKDLGAEGELCNLVLSPLDYHLYLVEAPSVDDSELRAAARWKVKDLLDGKPEDVAIDWFRVPQNAYRGRDMVYVVASPKARIRMLVDLVEECGLRLESIDIPELVMRNLAAHFVGDREGVAFMDLRAGGSTMNVTRQGELYLSRRINSKLDANIMQTADWDATRARLVMEIQRSLDYYESQMAMPSISKLVLVQRRYDGIALAAALGSELNATVEVLDLDSSLSSDVRLPPELQQLATLAIGATLRQFADPSRSEAGSDAEPSDGEVAA